MQQIKCARSLLTCWPPAVQSFSYATSIIYCNNKDWDFKGDPTSPVMNPQQGKPFVQGYNQRKREYGMRSLVYYSKPKYALNLLKGIQKSEQPILYDGSAEKDIKVLERKNLFLLFSKLNIPDPVIHSLKPVHEKLQEHKKYVIVWIPVEYKQWDQKTFEHYSREMPWYTLKCFPPSKDIIESEWKFRGNPMLTVMNERGKVDHPDALQLIKEKGVDALIAFLNELYN